MPVALMLFCSYNELKVIIVRGNNAWLKHV